VEAVLYPGLTSHPGHEDAKAEQSAVLERGGERLYGGMLSVLVGRSAADAKAVVAALRLWVPATSLGGPESLVEHRLTVEGAASLAPANLLRLSCGLEDAEDLLEDMLQALGTLTATAGGHSTSIASPNE